MTTNRKVLTGLAVLIVLSLLVVPASAFAAGADGSGRFRKVYKPWKVRRMEFNVAEENGVYPAYGSMWVHNAKCDNLLWSIPRVKCVTIDGSNAYFGGKGTGKMRGKFVMVVAKGGAQAIEVRATRNKRYFKYWCKHLGIPGAPYRWEVDLGSVTVPN